MVRLEPLEPEDLELLYTIENDRDMWSISNTSVPYSRYDLRDYILNQQHDIFVDRQLRLVIKNAQGSSVGLIDLFNFSPEHSRVELGLAILKSERGKGYATEALREMIKYVHGNLHLHQIYCIVPIDNAPSIAMLRAVGFTNEVILKDWILCPEEWHDAVSLQCLL